ncbi:laccase [Rhodoferax koreense]|uniref:Purine nucleoside phosphorylase n=1 Tax=Rhodoferax koreensis TaxID=1842727 RepID=A0A1P8JSX4_9BURK|nr:peptidoglycan editing factor PgeF [Rhodoferax koreense]APW36862.1 laccase [Rhodoferax koreense]
MSNPHPDWLRPAWPAPANVQAIFTTRAGGVSAAPFDRLNLGDHVNDAPEAVLANRAVLKAAITAEPVFLQQVHGTRVAALDTAPRGGPIVSDACLATQPGLACTIMVADCLPVLFSNRQGSAVAAAHAGWRGLAGEQGLGVLESTVNALLQAAGPGACVSDMIAWLGPCIGPEAFEVGDEVRAAFVAWQADAAALFRAGRPGKWFADLPGLARLRLRALGFANVQIHGNDGSPAWCTVHNPSRFFSYRREGLTGRMAACVWLA